MEANRIKVAQIKGAAENATFKEDKIVADGYI
mgnify:CR=1 FL=1